MKPSKNETKTLPIVIPVSFKTTEEFDMVLFNRIQMRCKMINKSGYIKEAVYEKLEREALALTNMDNLLESNQLLYTQQKPLVVEKQEVTEPKQSLKGLLNFS